METLTSPVETDIAAQVLAALGEAIPPAAVRERFGLSQDQFREIIREQNRKTIALLKRWELEDAARADESDVDIDELLRANPLSLREFSVE